jgi:hypothetical protein
MKKKDPDSDLRPVECLLIVSGRFSIHFDRVFKDDAKSPAPDRADPVMGEASLFEDLDASAWIIRLDIFIYPLFRVL